MNPGLVLSRGDAAADPRGYCTLKSRACVCAQILFVLDDLVPALFGHPLLSH